MISELKTPSANEGSTSSMEIEEVVNLLEKTILMIGQVNVVCLYERRLNVQRKQKVCCVKTK